MTRRPYQWSSPPQPLPGGPWSPTDSDTDTMAAAADITVALPPMLAFEPRPLTHALANAVTESQVSASDRAVNGPAARADYGVTGAGIKIGILSDSYNVLGGASADIAAGLLPSNGVTVLEEGPGDGSDEGRAMAEIAHATAPGAQLYFYTAFNSEQDFANGIAALHAAGCQVIVDDTTYPDESMFQISGAVDDAVRTAVSDGVDYFTAAGNEGTSFYQATFAPRGTELNGLSGIRNAQYFSNGTPYQSVTIPAQFDVTLTLDWEAPYNVATADSLTVVVYSGTHVVATSTQSGSEPNVSVDFPTVGVNATYTIAIFQNSGTPSPGLFKYVLEGGGTINDPGAGVGSGSEIGHALVPGANVVGAVDVTDTTTPESYSSTGPGELLFNSNGTALGSPETLNTPSFLAPDGSATSVLDPFYGTSAAAPVAAATAALMLQAKPSLNTSDVSVLLADSAIPTGAASVAGAGLIQSNLAVGYAATGLISGSAQPVIYGDSQADTLVGGAGTRELVAGGGTDAEQSFGANTTVLAGAGADTVDLAGASAILYGGSGPLLVRTMSGTDTVLGGTGSVTVPGGAGGGEEAGGSDGNNLLVAGDAATLLLAGGGNDTLQAAGGGNDSLYAAAGGGDVLDPGYSTGGNTYVAAGAGDNAIQTGAGNNLTFLGSGYDNVVTGGADTVVGGSGLAYVAVAGGQTEFFNGDGDATMVAGAGADTLVGNGGRVTLQGGSGPVLAFGGLSGDNLMIAGSGQATLLGGGAGDTIQASGNLDLVLAASGGGDTLRGGAGIELMVGGTSGTNVYTTNAASALVAPEASNAVITLGSGESTLQGGSGSAVVQLIDGQPHGIDFLYGFNPASDILLLTGYDQGASDQAVAQQYDTGGDSWLTLPDGTVVAFVGLSHFSANNVAFG
jgi:Ca2+-binding RTX toxin-like protein